VTPKENTMHDHHPSAHTTPPVTPQPPPPLPTPAPAVPLLLADVAPGRDLAGTPVTTWDGDTVVVLDYDPVLDYEPDVALSEVWSQRDGTRVLPAHTPVMPAQPDGPAFTCLRGAFAHLLDRVRTVATDRSVDRAHHQRVLDDIRCYAIDRHLDGCFDRDHLNAFLTSFGLPPYQRRYTAPFTITGSYQVEATVDNDEESVSQDAEDTLRPDLRFTPGVVESSEYYDVIVNTITLDDERAGTGTDAGT
jgi:hypothetical protein